MNCLDILNAIRNQSKLVLVEDFEIVVQHCKKEAQIFYSKNKIRTEWKEEFWASLRLYHRKTLGEASFLLTSLSEIPHLVEKAFYSVEISSADPWFHFPVWKPWQSRIQGLSPVTKRDFTPKNALVSGVADLLENHSETIVETCIYRKTEKQQIHFQNRFMESSARFEWRSGFINIPFSSSEFDVISEKICETAKTLQESRPEATGSHLPIQLDGKVLAQVLEVIWPVFTKPQINSEKRLWNSNISLSNSGSFLEEIPFDLEGVPTQKTNLVKEGLLLNLFSDIYASAKDNKMSTGSRVRLTGDARAIVGPQYFYCEPGLEADRNFEGVSMEFIEQIRFEGPSSRILSLLGHGYRYRGGERGDAVSHVFMQGDIFKLFGSALKLNRELKFVRNFGAPTVSFSRA